jgi:hypothetical protein
MHAGFSFVAGHFVAMLRVAFTKSLTCWPKMLKAGRRRLATKSSLFCKNSCRLIWRALGTVVLDHMWEEVI